MNCVGFEKLHFWKHSVFLQSRCHSVPRNSTSVNTNIITAYIEMCIICFVVVPDSQIFNYDFWKFTEWNFFIYSSFQSLLVVLYNMTDNFLQTTFKTALNSFLEVRRFHQSHPLSVMTWKVFIPLSAPYRELQVWFVKLKPKKFEKLFALKKPAQNIWFVRAFKSVLHSIFSKDLLNCIWLYRIVLKAFHNVSPLKALSSTIHFK